MQLEHVRSDVQPSKRAWKGGLQPGPFREGPASKVQQGFQHGIVENHSGLFGVAWRAGTEGKGHFGKGETGSKKGSLHLRILEVPELSENLLHLLYPFEHG